MKNIALIGMGWHARRIYVPWLRSATEHRWTIGVDLAHKATSIQENLGNGPKPELLFSPTQPHEAVSSAVFTRLEALHKQGRLDTLLLSADPIARRPWTEWALARGLDILVDKPLTAPALALSAAEVGASITENFEAIRRCHGAAPGRLWIQAQRRFHRGYLHLQRLIQATTARTGVPLTHLDISHADGMWVMPDEWERDHHPYRHGWGKLLHSGYHFVDLACWLLDADRAPALGRPRELQHRVSAVSAAEQQRRMVHQRMLETPERPPPPAHYGEVDVSVLGQLCEGGVPRTTMSLQLLQSSLSRRSSASPPADPYKGAGRVRHERVSAQVGPFLSVQVHSYQARELHEADERPYGPGHLDHFDLHIYRNPLLEGPAFERVEYGRCTGPSAASHNEQARICLLEAFLSGAQYGSSLEEHAQTHALLASIYEAIGTGKAGRLQCPGG